MPTWGIGWAGGCVLPASPSSGHRPVLPAPCPLSRSICDIPHTLWGQNILVLLNNDFQIRSLWKEVRF